MPLCNATGQCQPAPCATHARTRLPECRRVRYAISRAKPCEFSLYRSLARSRAAGAAATYDVIAGILEESIAFLDAGKTRDGADVVEGEEPPPTEVLFALLYLAQIRDEQGRYVEALALIERGE